MNIVEVKEKHTGTPRRFLVPSESIKRFRNILREGGLTRDEVKLGFVMDARGKSRAVNGLDLARMKDVGVAPLSWRGDGEHYTFDGLPFGRDSGP